MMELPRVPCEQRVHLQDDRQRIQRNNPIELPESITLGRSTSYTLVAVGWEADWLVGRYEKIQYMGHTSNRTTRYLRADGRFTTTRPPSRGRFTKRPERI